MLDERDFMSKLWGGRFSESTHQMVDEFSSSLNLDSRMWREDIHGSIAHALMLKETKILSDSDVDILIESLKKIESEIDLQITNGENPFYKSQAEDIHSFIEQKLNQICGASIAGKLHTARSRNDQVATDIRLYLQLQVKELIADIEKLQNWICKTSESNTETILPGLTHMQHAQPVSLAHHLMAYFWMLQRDKEKLLQCNERIQSLPLGAAALAGTSFPIDRQFVKEKLNFNSICENSMDAVSDRDFAIEFLSIAATTMMHLSRWAEEIVLWSMPEFNYINLPDSVTTGSSIMPQKKNPDVSELIRAHTGRVNGALIGILTLLKALPLAYNRDLQEDKFHLFNGLDSVRSCVKLMYCQIERATFTSQSMASKLRGDTSNATDLADDLAKKGVPFREAHEVVGQIVNSAITNNKPLEDFTLSDLQKFHPKFNEATLTVLPHLAVMNARTSEGGTSCTSIKNQISRAKNLLPHLSINIFILLFFIFSLLPQTSLAIVNGTELKIKENTNFVGLDFAIQGVATVAPCSGTYIGENTIITAAHCFLINEFDTEEVKICVYNIDKSFKQCFTKSELTVTYAPVQEWGGKAPTRKSRTVIRIPKPDIAVLKINKPLEKIFSIMPVYDLKSQPQLITESENFEIVGQGCTNYASFGEETLGLGTFRKGSVQLTNDKNILWTSSWTPETNASGVCWGDSGGSLLKYNYETNTSYLIGVISSMKTKHNPETGAPAIVISNYSRLDTPEIQNWLSDFSFMK